MYEKAALQVTSTADQRHVADLLDGLAIACFGDSPPSIHVCGSEFSMDIAVPSDLDIVGVENHFSPFGEHHQFVGLNTTVHGPEYVVVISIRIVMTTIGPCGIRREYIGEYQHASFFGQNGFGQHIGGCTTPFIGGGQLTSYKPAVVYSWIGDSLMLVWPSPKSHVYCVAFSDKFRKYTG